MEINSMERQSTAGVFVDTGDAISGTLHLLKDRDVSSCCGEDLTEEVEARTGVPKHNQRLFIGRKLIKLDTLLCSQGVVGNSTVYLHIPIIGGQPATVRVTNIAKTVTEEELREKFRLFGRIFHLNLIQSAREATNHCFVKYPSEEIAQQAIDDMNNEAFDGKRIRCHMAAPKGEQTEVYPVRVGNIPPGCFEKDVYETFRRYGDIASVKMPGAPTNRTYAFVNFRQLHDARRASSTPDTMKGRRIFITLKPSRTISLPQQPYPGHTTSTVPVFSQGGADELYFHSSASLHHESVTEHVACKSLWFRRYVMKRIGSDPDCFEHARHVRVSQPDSSRLRVVGRRRYVNSVVSEIEQLQEKVRTKVLHFPKHGALSTHLLPLYNEVATAINGEDGVVGVDAPLSVNDDENFTVTLRAMNGRHFGSACGKLRAVDEQVTVNQTPVTDGELADVQAGIGRRHYSLMSSAVCYTFEHKTVVVTGTTKENADSALAAVKKFLQEAEKKATISLNSHGALVIVAKLSVITSMADRYQPPVKIRPVVPGVGEPSLELRGQRQHVNALTKLVKSLIADLMKTVYSTKVPVRAHGNLAHTMHYKYAEIKSKFEVAKTALIVLPEWASFITDMSHAVVESFEAVYLQHATKQISAVDQSVFTTRMNFDQWERSSVKAGVKTGKLVAIGRQAYFVIEQNTVIVTGLTKSDAEAHAATVKKFVQEAEMRKTLYLQTFGEVILLAKLSVFASMGRKYQPFVKVISTNHKVDGTTYPAIEMTGQRQHVNALTEEVTSMVPGLQKEVHTAEAVVDTHGRLGVLLYDQYCMIQSRFELARTVHVKLPEKDVFTKLPAKSVIITLESFEKAELHRVHMHICDIDRNVCTLMTHLTHSEKSSIECGIAEGRTEYLWGKSSFTLEENTAVVTGLSRVDAEEHVAKIKAFLHGEVVVSQCFQFPSVAMEKLILKTRFSSVSRLIRQANLEFSLDLSAYKTDTEERAELCVTGKRYCMVNFTKDFDQEMADLRAKFTRVQFSVSDISMTCLPAASDEIHALTSTHGVFYWTFTVPELEEDLENEDFNVENYGEKFEIEEANKAKEEYVEKTSRPTGVWLWEGSDGWMEHSPTDSARIDEAAGDACPVEVFIENERYTVWPSVGYQLKSGTDVKHRIRKKAIQTGTAYTLPTTPVIWQIADSDGLFRDYDKKTSLALEKAYTKNEELVKVSSFSVVDLVKMKEVTKFSSAVRKVRRVEMDLPTPVELLAPQPVVIGTQRCIVQTHSAVGNAPLPDSVTVIFDKFNDSPQLADDSEQAIRAILNAHLHTEKVPFPEVFSRQMMVQLKNLAQVFRVSVSLFSHAKEGRNYITVTGTPEKTVKKSLELVNRWAYKALVHRSTVPKPMVTFLYPQHWEEQTTSSELKEVSMKSQEFLNVQEYLKASLQEATLHTLHRVQNKAVWRNYCQFKENIAEKLEVRLEEVVERRLFHSQEQSFLSPRPHVSVRDEICRGAEGFSMKYASAGNWGEGIYYSPSSKYCSMHTPKREVTGLGFFGTKKCNLGEMILAQVCLGETTRLPQNPSLRKPPQKPTTSQSSVADKMQYDMVTGNDGHYEVFISYSDNQAYPLYLLTYWLAAK